MKPSLVRVLALLLAATGLMVVGGPAQASPPYWTITDVTGSPATLSNADGFGVVGVECPADQTPVSGHTLLSAPGDVRRFEEKIGFGGGAAYEVSLSNQTGGAGSITVTPVVRCVPLSYFAGSYTVSQSRTVVRDAVESGVSCLANDFALSYSVDFEDPSSTLLASYPGGSSWTIDGWSAGDGRLMTVKVHCLDDADSAGLARYDTSMSDTASGEVASVSCGPSMQPVVGGNRYQETSLASGAVFVDAHPTSTGWVSVASIANGGTTWTRVWCMPTAGPVVNVDVARSVWADEPVWTFTADDPTDYPWYGMEVECRQSVDGQAGEWFPCGASPMTRILPDGVHRLTVRATTGDGRIGRDAAEIVIDTTPPTVAMSAPAARFTVATAATARWTASDAGSGVAGFDARWRRAPYNGAFGTWSAPTALGAAARSKAYGSLLPGSTYCFSTRGRDAFDNVSPYPAAACTSIPVDDRGLTRSSGWTKVARSTWFRGTGLSTRRRGATLTAKGAIVKRVAVTALKCPSCGTLGVYAGGTRIGVVDLTARTTARRTVVLPAFNLGTRAVTLKVLSADKPVQVDAVGLSRY